MADLNRVRTALFVLLTDEERDVLHPYLCPAGVPTIGRGLTTYPDGRKVQLTDPPITAEQSADMTRVEIERYMGAVIGMTREAVGTNELIALTSCAWNIGIEGLRGSSMIRLHLAGNRAGAARAFDLWNKMRDPRTKRLVESRGLTARRKREAAIYLTPDAPSSQTAPDTPQAAAPESSLASSPIMQGSTVVATVSAGAAILQELKPPIETTTGFLGHLRALVVDTLGIPVEWWPWLVVGAAVYIGWWRWRQRRGGWA
jgi:lysozyme